MEQPQPDALELCIGMVALPLSSVIIIGVVVFSAYIKTVILENDFTIL
jgi:hypothetical protein